MVEPVTAVLTGIALVKKSVDFIKTNINTAQDIGDIMGHVDKALNGQQQVIKDRDSKNVDHFATENVAKEIIDARLAQEELYMISQLIDHRFGHGTWKFILAERKKRIDKHKEAIKEAKAKKLKKQKEMYDMVRMGFIVLAVISFMAVAIGITVKIVLAHTILDQNDQSCKIFEPRYFLICLSEGKERATIEFELDQKKNKGNWIVDDDE